MYFGDGKGKTSAAVGLCVRALGNGIPVVFAQFLKEREAGEVESLSALGARIFRGKGTGKFTFEMTPEERLLARSVSDRNFLEAVRISGDLSKRSMSVLVLDEICAAWNSDLIDKKSVSLFLEERNPRLEVVLTGRNPPDFFLEKADYATEMRKVRHPFDSGLGARKGVEF